IGYLVVPTELQEVFATAKQFADRHSPVAEQEALACLFESGGYEGHVRRVRRLNGERRETLLGALRHSFGDRIAVQGADAGLHVAVWFNDLPRSQETTLVEAARGAGLGLHLISPLYERQSDEGHIDRVGLVMGYAALSIRQIEKGVEILRAVVKQVQDALPGHGA
ncbi:PLP-dependent aminotransferase family protein, partial [Mesorhizobium sp. M0809]